MSLLRNRGVQAPATVALVGERDAYFLSDRKLGAKGKRKLQPTHAASTLIHLLLPDVSVRIQTNAFKIHLNMKVRISVLFMALFILYNMERQKESPIKKQTNNSSRVTSKYNWHLMDRTDYLGLFLKHWLPNDLCSITQMQKESSGCRQNFSSLLFWLYALGMLPDALALPEKSVAVKFIGFLS